jgi:hypothetical protein
MVISCLMVPAILAQSDSPDFVRGDANGDERINANDVQYILAFLFRGGPPIEPYENGDVNCDAAVNISDVVYLIEAIYMGGPPPCEDPK